MRPDLSKLTYPLAVVAEACQFEPSHVKSLIDHRVVHTVAGDDRFPDPQLAEQFTLRQACCTYFVGKVFDGGIRMYDRLRGVWTLIEAELYEGNEHKPGREILIAREAGLHTICHPLKVEDELAEKGPGFILYIPQTVRQFKQALMAAVGRAAEREKKAVVGENFPPRVTGLGVLLAAVGRYLNEPSRDHGTLRQRLDDLTGHAWAYLRDTLGRDATASEVQYVLDRLKTDEG
jgi:hypothetical protein